MKLLSDQDIYAVTVELLRQDGHDVVTAANLKLSRASDTDLLAAAATDGRALLTRDRDFGGLIVSGGIDAGAIYLRISPSTLNAVHSELLRVLSLYSESELLHSLIVVEPSRHRVRRRLP